MLQDGSVKLDWFGIQYYNAVSAVCCGGGGDTAQATLGIAQNYKNLAAGWPGVTQDDMASNRAKMKRQAGNFLDSVNSSVATAHVTPHVGASVTADE